MHTQIHIHPQHTLACTHTLSTFIHWYTFICIHWLTYSCTHSALEDMHTTWRWVSVFLSLSLPPSFSQQLSLTWLLGQFSELALSSVPTKPNVGTVVLLFLLRMYWQISEIPAFTTYNRWFQDQDGSPVFALHIADLSWIFGIPYGPLSLPGVISYSRVRSKPWALSALVSKMNK